MPSNRFEHDPYMNIGSVTDRRRFPDDPDCVIRHQLAPAGHHIAFLGNALYDDHLCLVASNNQQILWTKIFKQFTKTVDH